MESGDELAAAGIGRTAAKEKNSVVSEAYRSRDRDGMGAFCAVGAVGAVPDSTDFRKYRDRLLHGADDMGEAFNQTTAMDDVFFVRGAGRAQKKGRLIPHGIHNGTASLHGG